MQISNYRRWVVTKSVDIQDCVIWLHERIIKSRTQVKCNIQEIYHFVVDIGCNYEIVSFKDFAKSKLSNSLLIEG